MLLVYTLGFILGMLVPFCGAYTPSAEVTINQAALDYVSDRGRDIFQKSLKMQLPPLYQPEKDTYFQHTPIVLFENNITQFTLNFIPNIGFRLLIAGRVQLMVLLKKNIQKVNVEISSIANIFVSKASIGTPFLDISFCKTNIGTVSDIYREDGLKELWSPLRGYIDIMLPDKICLKISSLIGKLNAYMGTMIGLSPIGPESQIRYTFIQLPVITKEYLSWNISATLFLLGKPVTLASNSSHYLPNRVGSRDAMVNFGFSQNLLNSIQLLMQKSGSINMDITGQLNSKNNQLTTSVLGHLIPQVLQKYPNSMPIALKIRTNAIPISSIYNHEMILQLNYLLEVLAVSSNSAFNSLFNLAMSVTLNVRIISSEMKLQASVSLLRDMDFSVVFSNVGSFDLSMVKPLLTSAIKTPLITHLNALLGLGIVLPNIANVSYVNPQIFLDAGYIVVSCGLYF